MKHVLIVEDDADVLELVAELLEDTYRVSTAPSGPAALEILSRDPNVDCIILDLMMPKMSGEEFTIELRRRGFSMPVIVASARRDARQVAAQIGAHAALAKPYSCEDLMASLDRATSPVRA